MNLSVCVGTSCHIKGSYNVINIFQQAIEEYKLSDLIKVEAVFCLGHCTSGVSVKIDDSEVYSVSGATAKKFFESEVLKKAEQLEKI